MLILGAKDRTRKNKIPIHNKLTTLLHLLFSTHGGTGATAGKSIGTLGAGNGQPSV